MIEQTSFTMSDVDTYEPIYEPSERPVERTYNALRLDSLNSMIDTDFNSFPTQEVHVDAVKPVDCYLDHDMKQENTAESSQCNEDETAEDIGDVTATSPVSAFEIEQSVSVDDDTTLVSIVVDSLSMKDHSELSVRLPLISRNGVEGFEIKLIVDKAMWVLNLDPRVGIHAEYYSVSHKQFINVENVETQLVSIDELTNVEQ